MSVGLNCEWLKSGGSKGGIQNEWVPWTLILIELLSTSSVSTSLILSKYSLYYTLNMRGYTRIPSNDVVGTVLAYSQYES